MPSCGFSLAVSGMMNAALLTSFFFSRLDQDAVAQRFDVQCHTFVFLLLVVLRINSGPHSRRENFYFRSTANHANHAKFFCSRIPRIRGWEKFVSLTFIFNFCAAPVTRTVLGNLKRLQSIQPRVSGAIPWVKIPNVFPRPEGARANAPKN